MALVALSLPVAICLHGAQAGGAAADPAIVIIPRPAPAAARPLLRMDASLVLVPVHVTDALGETVKGLRRDDFRLLEDRVEQTIATFDVEEAPVSIGILFDASGSMEPKMAKALDAAAAFFRTAGRDDEFFLVEFNDKARLTVPFTGSSGNIYREIAHTRPRGRTTLIDALDLSLRQMKNARHARKAIVIVSDGGDNWSRHSAPEIRGALMESDVQVYAMGVYGAEMATSEEKNGPELLDRLTEATGGRHYRVDSQEKLPEISARIGRELRSEYVLGYYSTNPARDGKYRSLEVKIAAPRRGRLHADYRRGYYAPLP